MNVNKDCLAFGMQLMSFGFLASHSRIVLTAAGMALVELAAGMAISAPSPANTLSEKLSSQPSNVELAGQPSGSLMAKEEETVEDDIKLLPQSMTDAIFKEVSQKSGVQASQLRIVKVERETWSDGCLGLANADTMCTQATVPGWRVIVANGEQRWVYRTNESGSLMKLDEVATRSITSNSTTQLTRREEVTTGRTSQTTQAVTGSTSTQNRTSQNTQAIAGSSQTTQGTTSQRTQAIAGSSQTTQGTTTRTQQQVALARSRAKINFADVPEGHWARDFIAELAMRGIFTGFPDGKFHPNEPVTRAQFAALVSSVFKQTKVRDVSNFVDVSTRHWAYNGIREAYEMGFLEAISGNTFNPNQSLSRLQILTALAKGLNYTASSSTEQVLQFYSDAAAIPTSTRSLIAAATERGIVANYPNVKTFSPNQVATRAEVAAFLYQAMVSNGNAQAISSPYVATQTGATQADDARQVGGKKPARQNCNQGIGNGSEGCDPGNSRPHGGSNDETGRTPGNNKK
ncbi:MAG TPA: S-layer homology domain-containing protein [Coleofasciculaceae cyanobacterium]